MSGREPSSLVSKAARKVRDIYPIKQSFYIPARPEMWTKGQDLNTPPVLVAASCR